MKRPGIPHLGGARALVLHRAHADGAAVLRQLAAIGLSAEAAWPDLPADAMLADFVFFDADMACDEQMPWAPGEAPMPLIALIGTEAPGRVEWALRQRADAHLVKPVGNAGIYSALLIARQKFEERKALYREIDSLRGQVAERRTVVRAVLRLTERGQTEAEAFALLRRLAMDGQTTLEAAAARLLGDSDGGAGERSRRP
ncbi:ANTAR domain-containing response regulator [Mesorhizobium sp. AaZ16]|uniref:ANTAR domain-containing response regulator n=1 Tax=Mesorhizobium sp. AaZ16 TaxID=3402289 RepID=UPI00374FB0CA